MFTGILTGIGSLFTGWQSSLIQIIAIIIFFVFIGVMGFAIVHEHDKGIAAAALSAQTQKQMSIIIEEQKEEAVKMDVLSKFQADLQKSLNETNTTIAVSKKDFQNYVSNPITKKGDRAASKILKDTLQKTQD